MTEADARAALTAVSYPGLKRDIVSLGLVHAVNVHDGHVHVSLALATERDDVPTRLRAAIGEQLAAAGAVSFEVEIMTPGQATRAKNPWGTRAGLANVAHVVAVGAGKGGVGKSTVAVNLALALQDRGYRVGVLDADIYGPSVPVLVGLEDGASRIGMSEQKQIVPLEALGLAIVSFGFFLGPRSPAVWRGPMVAKAVKQFARGVLWPPLDVLVVDLPPGTGDVPLSLAQTLVVDGAVVVTTPQRLAVLEAGKAVEMFRKLDVPVLGVVENMSFAECECGRRSHPFGHGGGVELTDALGLQLLGSVPFDEEVVHGGDTGDPSVQRRPTSATAGAFREIAHRIAEGLSLAKPASATAAAVADARLSEMALPSPVAP